MRTTAGAATTALLVGCITGVGPRTPNPALADDELHNVTYLARVDGVAPGGPVTLTINDTETSSASLTWLPGPVFEAHAVLSDPGKAAHR